MSWLMPGLFGGDGSARLDALVASIPAERERAIEAATTMELQTGADRQRVQVTLGGINSRLALQEQRAAARREATTLDARARLILGDLLDDAGGGRKA